MNIHKQLSIPFFIICLALSTHCKAEDNNHLKQNIKPTIKKVELETYKHKTTPDGMYWYQGINFKDEIILSTNQKRNIVFFMCNFENTITFENCSNMASINFTDCTFENRTDNQKQFTLSVSNCNITGNINISNQTPKKNEKDNRDNHINIIIENSNISETSIYGTPNKKTFGNCSFFQSSIQKIELYGSHGDSLSIQKCKNIKHILFEQTNLNSASLQDDEAALLNLYQATFNTFFQIESCSFETIHAESTLLPPTFSIGKQKTLSQNVIIEDVKFDRNFNFPEYQGINNSEDLKIKNTYSALNLLNASNANFETYNRFSNFAESEGLKRESQYIFLEGKYHEAITEFLKSYYTFLSGCHFCQTFQLLTTSLTSSFLLAVTFFTAYGKSSFIWHPVTTSVILIFMGAWFFKAGEIEAAEKLKEIKTETSPFRKFNPLLYSLDLFLPGINLKIEENWKPKTRSAFWYFIFLKIAGHVLVGVVLACWIGLFK